MAYPTHQQYADLAKDAYENRIPSKDEIPIGGNKYEVLAVSNDRRSGYQGTVYYDVKNHAVIVAHRGTESPKDDWKDAVADAVMVLDRKNGQAQAAVNLTKQAMAQVAKIHAEDPAKPMPTLSHTGHSLGGSHAQINAHYFNHPAVTFNAYGAASLGRIPEGTSKGGANVTNYVKASDPVAAAADHYGKVVVLATPDEIGRIDDVYSNSRTMNAVGQLSPIVALGRVNIVAASSVGKAHSISNFTGRDSILADSSAQSLAHTNKVMISAYRNDVNTARSAIGLVDNIRNPIPNIGETIDMLKPDRPAGQPARENLPPLTQSRPFSLEDLPLNAQNIHKRIEGHLTGYYEQSGLPVEADKIRNAAMALTAACCEKQMKDAPLFAVKDDRFLVGEKNPFLVRASMDMAQAEMMQPEESMKKIHETQQRFEHEAQSRQMEQARGISMV